MPKAPQFDKIFIKMKIISFSTIPSTNSYCAENIDELHDEDIIIAQTQSAGRGRKERSWSSEEGGLYFSLVLKEGVSLLSAPGVLTQIMALAVCKTVKDLGIKAYIKWPNDVLSGGKKFCGILSEAIFEDSHLKAVIIGVGINLSQSEISSDKPFVTLKELGVNIGPNALLKQIFENFRSNLILLKKEGFKALREEYKKDFAYLGQQVTMRIFEDIVTGTAKDIDEEGRLLLLTDSGLKTISIGDMDF